MIYNMDILSIKHYKPEEFPITPDNKQKWTQSYMQYAILWEHYHDISIWAPYADFGWVPKEELKTFLQGIFQRAIENIPTWLNLILEQHFTYEEQLLINPHLSRQQVPIVFDDTREDLFTYLTTHHHLGLHLDSYYLELLAEYFTQHTVTLRNRRLLLQITYFNKLNLLEKVFAQHPILFERLVNITSRTYWHRKTQGDSLNNYSTESHPYATYISLNFLKSPANIFPSKMCKVQAQFEHVIPHKTASLYWFQEGSPHEHAVIRSYLKHHAPSVIAPMLKARYPEVASIFNMDSERFVYDMVTYLYETPSMSSEVDVHVLPS